MQFQVEEKALLSVIVKKPDYSFAEKNEVKAFTITP